MLRALVEQLTKYPVVFLMLFLGIIGLSATIAVNISIEPDFSTLISDEGEYNSNARKLEAAFGQNNGLAIVYTLDEESKLQNRPTDLRDTTIQEDVETLATLLEESQHVVRVSDIQFTDNGKYGRVIVTIFEPNRVGSLLDVQNELQYYIDQTPKPPGVDVAISGLPTLLDRVSNLLITDNLNTVFITLSLVFIVLLIFFRSVKLSLVGISAPTISLITLGACMVLLNIDITLTLAAVGVIVLGLGADYSIHLMTAYARHLREGHSPQESILEAYEELDVALIGAFLTTLAGFAALILGASPSSQAQGTVLSLAITIIFVVTMLMLPVLLVLFVKKVPKGAARTPLFLKKFFTKLAHFQTHHPWRVIGIVGIITVIMFVGAGQVGFSTSNSNWIPDDDPVSESFRELVSAFGDTDNLILVIESTDDDLRNVHTVRDMQELQSRLEGIPDINGVSSPVDGIPLTPADVFTYTSQEPIRSAFNRDFTITTITVESSGFEVNEAGDSTVLPDVREIVDRTPVYNAKISFFGDVVRFKELGDSLEQDAGRTTLIGLALVFVVSTILYMSFAVGFVSLLPIILAVIWAVGLMGFTNVPFNSLSTGIVSLVLGIGVDFSIHLVNSTNYALRKKKQGIQEAIEEALHTSGGAIFLSSVTTFFGFTALTFAMLLGTQRLGWSLAYSILCVFIVTILFVPAIMSLQNRRRANH